MNTSVWEMSFWGLIKAGGPIMIPILICSFIALAIVIEKFIFFKNIKSDVTSLKKKVFELIKMGKNKEALKLCDADPSPVAEILKAGLLKIGSSKEEIAEDMQTASLYEIPLIECRLNILATIAHVTPLIGFLGTVIGMLNSFHVIQVRASSLNPVTPGDLSGGISEALITTIAGLMVAIPTYIAHNYFAHQTNTVIIEMEKAATEMAHLSNRYSDSNSPTIADEI